MNRSVVLLSWIVVVLGELLCAPVQARPAPPPAPSALSCLAISATQINLSWRDNSTTESGFILQRALSSGGPWSQVGTTGANVTSFANGGLSPATTYYYRVCAYNSRGRSSYSTVASATTATGCTYVLSASGANASASGGSGSVNVTAGAACSWTATTGYSWIHTTSSGTGNGTVSYSVDPNTSTASRSGTLSVQGQAFTINQAGAVACTYTLSATTVSSPAAGGPGSVNVTAGSGCAWTAATGYSWIHTTSSGTGSGVLNYAVDANTSTAARSGTISVQGQVLTINQSGAVACSYSLSASSASLAAAGGTRSFNITASSSTCPWAASTAQSWITLNAPSSGSGSGTVSFTVAANSSTSGRSGSISVAGLTFSVSQAGATPDNPPTATLTSPASGAVLSGSVAFTGTATDDVGVTRVEFWCDGSLLLGTDTTSPYSVVYDSHGIPNGSHTFTCKAYDTAGNLATSSAISATVNNASTGVQLQWVRDMIGGLKIFPGGVVADRANNVVVAGGYSTSADFGGGSVPSTGALDIFIAKYTAQNGFLWARHFGNTGDDRANAVATDSQNNVIVTGSFQKTVDFGGASLSANDPLNVGQPDIFVAKYSSAGNLLWAVRLGGDSYDVGRGLAVDASDNIILTATFTATSAFGAVTLVSTAGSGDVAVAKLSGSNGATLWAKGWGGSAYDFPNSVAVDRAGDVVVTGSLGGPANLGGGLSAGGGIFVAKYAGSDGSYRWAKVVAGVAGNGVAIDTNTGNIFVTGELNGTTDFGTLPVNGGIFLTAYNSAGVCLWAKGFGGLGDAGRAVSVDASGNAVITGSASALLDFRGDYSYFIGGTYYLASFTGAGAFAWALRPASNGGIGTGVVVDSTGRVSSTGNFQGTADFGGTSITAVIMSDGFLVQYR